MKKRVFYTEWAYVAGLAILALGAALMEKADFGLSMVVAPAYLLHLRLVKVLPFFSFGMAEYTLQAALLILMCLALRSFRPAYLFSFVTAVVYGFLLDGMMALVALLGETGPAVLMLLYVLGALACALGVALLFKTYIPPEVYELAVKEISGKYGWNIHRVKTVYDCVSCLAAVAMSFAFFGLWHFEGVKAGTILVALVNGWLISLCSRALERLFEFRDGLSLRKRLS